MKKAFLILVLMASTCHIFAKKATEQITVEIDFGANKPSQTHQLDWTENMTALLALQYCANIETKPIKSYLFVTDIEGVKNIPTETVWYYEINDQKPKLLAFRQAVNKGDKIKWIYKDDVCSAPNNASLVTFEIRFGNNRPKQTYTLDWKENATVMSALQSLVLIQTYPDKKEGIFVYSIDGEKSIDKKSLWSYFLNGKKGSETPISQLLNKGDHVVWELGAN